MKKWMVGILIIGMFLTVFLSVSSEYGDRRVIVDGDWDFMLPSGYSVYDLIADERLVFFSHQGIQRIDPEKGEGGTWLWIVPWDPYEGIRHGVRIYISSDTGYGDAMWTDQEWETLATESMRNHYAQIAVDPESMEVGVDCMYAQRPWICCKTAENIESGVIQFNLYCETLLQDHYVQVALMADDEGILAENMELMRGIAGSLRYLPAEGMGADMGLHEDRLRQGLNATMWIMLAVIAALMLGLALLIHVSRRGESTAGVGEGTGGDGKET